MNQSDPTTTTENPTSTPISAIGRWWKAKESTWSKAVQPLRGYWRSAQEQPLFEDINKQYADLMHYSQADRLTLNLLWWHLAVLMVLLTLNAGLQLPAVLPSPLGWRIIYPGEAATLLALGLLAVAIPLWVYKHVENHYCWRLVAAFCLLVFGYLFIYISGGAVEMHYQLLFVIFYFCLYADWRAHWYLFAAIALQHMLSDILLARPLYFYGYNSLSPVVNLSFFLIATIFATIISRNYRYAVEDLVLAKQRNDQFIAIASHELRTPLTSIKGYAEVIHRRMKRHNNPSLPYIEKIEDQLSKVNNMIRDLLDISTRQAGRVQLEIQDLSIETVITQAIEEVQATAHHHEITVQGNQRIMIQGDRIRLGQLMANLLTNAMKYSPQADTIVVKVASARDKVIISVQDFGIGVSRQDQRKIFEPYFRSSDTLRNNVPGGLGMGLFISSEIVHSHRGKIWVESAPGKGATFSFMLPRPPHQ